MKSIIGGDHCISKDVWALSLVCKLNKEHAYLILEGVDEKEQRIIRDAHLVIKDGTNNKKAKIIFRTISFEELKAAGAGCHRQTWDVSATRAEAFIKLVEAEQERDINYLLFGQAPVLAGTFVSMAPAGGYKSVDDSKNNKSLAYVGHSCDMLHRPKGHNCVSWAKAMLKAMQLPVTGSWLSFIAEIPSLEVPKEPQTDCLIL